MLPTGSQSIAGGGGGGAHSIISNRKTSTISGHKPEGAGPGDKKDKKDKKQDDTTTQLSTSPPPGAPIARRLSVSASVAGEEGLMSCVLPEDLLVEILADRLQVGQMAITIIVCKLESVYFGVAWSITTSCVLFVLNKLDIQMLKIIGLVFYQTQVLNLTSTLYITFFFVLPYS